MNELSEALSRFRLPLKRDHLQQAKTFAAPATRYARNNPLLLIGAGVVALAGFIAWTQRDRIGAKAGPLLEEAKAKGLQLMDEARSRSQTLFDEAKSRSQTLIDDAGVKGHDLLDAARAKSEAVAEKVASVRRGANERLNDVH